MLLVYARGCTQTPAGEANCFGRVFNHRPCCPRSVCAVKASPREGEQLSAYYTAHHRWEKVCQAAVDGRLRNNADFVLIVQRFC